MFLFNWNIKLEHPFVSIANSIVETVKRHFDLKNFVKEAKTLVYSPLKTEIFFLELRMVIDKS